MSWSENFYYIMCYYNTGKRILLTKAAIKYFNIDGGIKNTRKRKITTFSIGNFLSISEIIAVNLNNVWECQQTKIDNFNSEK